MTFFYKTTGVLTAVLLAAVLFVSPVSAEHGTKANCTTIQEDIDHLAKVLEDKGAKGKTWLWTDTGWSMIIFASDLLKPETALLVFYDAQGCLMPNPGTGAIRTAVELTDKIRAYISRSKLFWKNTDDVLLSSYGFAI